MAVSHLEKKCTDDTYGLRCLCVYFWLVFFPPSARNFSHCVAEKSSPVKNCTQHSQAFLSSIHMLPSLTATPERLCFLS